MVPIREGSGLPWKLMQGPVLASPPPPVLIRAHLEISAWGSACLVSDSQKENMYLGNPGVKKVIR